MYNYRLMYVYYFKLWSAFQCNMMIMTRKSWWEAATFETIVLIITICSRHGSIPQNHISELCGELSVKQQDQSSANFACFDIMIGFHWRYIGDNGDPLTIEWWKWHHDYTIRSPLAPIASWVP
jgi:hypothetical protein